MKKEKTDETVLLSQPNSNLLEEIKEIDEENFASSRMFSKENEDLVLTLKQDKEISQRTPLQQIKVAQPRSPLTIKSNDTGKMTTSYSTPKHTRSCFDETSEGFCFKGVGTYRVLSSLRKRLESRAEKPSSKPVGASRVGKAPSSGKIKSSSSVTAKRSTFKQTFLHQFV